MIPTPSCSSRDEVGLMNCRWKVESNTFNGAYTISNLFEKLIDMTLPSKIFTNVYPQLRILKSRIALSETA